MGNPFDELGEFDPEADAIQKAKNEQTYHHVEYLIHQTFEQTECGRELLQLWTKESLILRPVAQPGDGLLEVGIKQGMQDFIRNLIVTVEKVSNER